MIAAAVCLLLVSLDAVHLVMISAYEPRYLPVCRVDTTERLVSLTFDDGPDPAYSSRIIALLERYDGHGTFFLIGSRASRYPHLVSAELEAGMELGNHTWSHVRQDLVSTTEMIAQVERTDMFLSAAGGRSGLFRAPFGDMTADQSRALARSGSLPIHWSLAVDHYVGGLGMSPSDAAASLARDVRRGDIILAHDAQIGPRECSGRAPSSLRDTRPPPPQTSCLRLSVRPDDGTPRRGLEGKGHAATVVLAIGVCLSARVTRVGGSMTNPPMGGHRRTIGNVASAYPPR